MNRKQKNKLSLKLVVYYATMVAFVALLIHLFPQIMPLLPFGGLEELQQGIDPLTETDLVNLVTYVQIPMDMFADGMSITFSMLGALLVMIPVRWVYLAVGDLETVEDKSLHKVSASLLLLPLVVTAIIVIVKFSLALGIAFALSIFFVFTALALEPLSDESPSNQLGEDQGLVD